MPVVEVKLYEERLTDDLAARLIEKMTDALVACTSEQLRDHTWVIVTAPPAGVASRALLLSTISACSK